MQNYAEFHGGGDGTEIQPNSERGMPLKKKATPEKKATLYNVCPQIDVLRFSFRRAYHIHYMYIIIH